MIVEQSTDTTSEATSDQPSSTHLSVQVMAIQATTVNTRSGPRWGNLLASSSVIVTHSWNTPGVNTLDFSFTTTSLLGHHHTTMESWQERQRTDRLSEINNNGDNNNNNNNKSESKVARWKVKPHRHKKRKLVTGARHQLLPLCFWWWGHPGFTKPILTKNTLLSLLGYCNNHHHGILHSQMTQHQSWQICHRYGLFWPNPTRWIWIGSYWISHQVWQSNGNGETLVDQRVKVWHTLV